jgi:hypothetical protein
MTNLFPLPYWAPALKRVPIPLQVLNEAFVRGIQFAPSALDDARAALDPALAFSPFGAPLSATGEDVSRFAPG